MDSEEFEQIPWSALVAEQNDGVDRRVYLAIGLVGIVIAVVLGVRLFGSSAAQPSPPAAADPQPVVAVDRTTSTAGVIVSEADLMAGEPDVLRGDDDLELMAIAEWFVTDYFTTDGSPETVRSIRSLFSAIVIQSDLPHDAEPAPAVTYVEWAKATGIRFVADEEVELKVAFRTITDSGDGFERDPVRAVAVTVLLSPGSAGVAGPPIEIPVPTIGG